MTHIIQPQSILHQSNNLVLRRTHPDDAEMLYKKAFGDPEFMRLFRLNGEPENIQQLRNNLQRQWQSSPDKSGYLEMLIIHKQHGPIGIIALAEFSRIHQRAEYLIGLFKGKRNAGYGIEATLMTMDLGFNQYSLNKIEAYTYAYNIEPQNNLKGLGFEAEGIRKGHLYSKQEKTFIDLCAFGMTRETFQKNKRLSCFSQRLLGQDITLLPQVQIPQAQSSKVKCKQSTTIQSPKALKHPVKRLLAASISAILGLSSPAYATTYLVDSATDNGNGASLMSPGAGNQTLSWAIFAANQNPGPDTITLTTDVTVTNFGFIKSLINSDITLQSDATPRFIDFDGRGNLFIKSGNVLIKDITIKNGYGKGGKANGGGSGAGMGGALFVYDANLTIQNSTFRDNKAQGGNGNGSGKGSGGGLGGSGMGGRTTNGGESDNAGSGLFYRANGDTGGYGGNGNYGGYANGGFGGGGNANPAVAGGFGGGGGSSTSADGAAGGFGGGGGGSTVANGGIGGFGGGGGTSSTGTPGAGGYGAGSGNATIGGGGAGFGGAIFIKKGTLNLIDVSFNNNSVTAGAGANAGTASGADIFICTSAQGGAECSAVVNACGSTSLAIDVGGGTLGTSCFTPSTTSCSSTAVNIQSITYNEMAQIKSELGVQTQGAVEIPAGIAVEYLAPQIVLGAGFHAKAGSKFTARVDEGIACTSEAIASIRTFSAKGDSLTIPTAITTAASSSDWLVPSRSRSLVYSDLPDTLKKILSKNQAEVVELYTDNNGKFIIFSSKAALLANDQNDYSDVYLYQIAENKLSLISLTAEGIAANSSSDQARINADGEYIIYRSEANNLNSPYKDSNTVTDIYLYHINSKQTLKVSWQEDGSQTQYAASYPAISGNLPYIVYEKEDSNLQQHIYGFDILSKILGSVKYSKETNNFVEKMNNIRPEISGDGRYISYIGLAGENNSCTLHIIDRETGKTNIQNCPDGFVIPE